MQPLNQEKTIHSQPWIKAVLEETSASGLNVKRFQEWMNEWMKRLSVKEKSAIELSHHVSWGTARHREGFPGPDSHTLAHTLTQHEGANISPFLSPFLWKLSQALKKRVVWRKGKKAQFIPGDLLSFHRHNTEVAETCYNVSSSSYCTIMSLLISLRNWLISEVWIMSMRISCRPEGLLWPSKHQEYPAVEKERCLRHAKTPTLLAHPDADLFLSLVKKKKKK